MGCQEGEAVRALSERAESVVIAGCLLPSRLYAEAVCNAAYGVKNQ
jgi:hypothetical protein